MQRSNLLLLALCLCTALASAHVPPASKCKNSKTMAGGWSEAKSVPKPVYTALQKALRGTLSCKKPAVKLLGACSQVVAGTNFEVNAQFTCKGNDTAVRVSALVWVRLAGKQPKVTTLTISGVPNRRLLAQSGSSSGDGKLHPVRIPPRPKKDRGSEPRWVPRRPQLLRKKSM